MNGAFMAMAFVMGFWCIWSANRDVNSLMEALGFTIVAIVVKAIMEWSGMPQIDNLFLATWGVIWVYNVFLLEMVDRFSTSMGMNMAIAVVGSGIWFGLAQYIFSPSGSKMLAGLIG